MQKVRKRISDVGAVFYASDALDRPEIRNPTSEIPLHPFQQINLGSVISSMAYFGPSRPDPLILTPP